MPVIEGAEHYAYSGRVVEVAGTDVRALGVAAASITDRDGVAIVPRDPTTYAPIPLGSFTTSADLGVTPECLLPRTGVWMDFGIKRLWVVSDDVPQLAQDAAAAKASALDSAAQVAALKTEVEAYMAQPVASAGAGPYFVVKATTGTTPAWPYADLAAMVSAGFDAATQQAVFYGPATLPLPTWAPEDSIWERPGATVT